MLENCKMCPQREERCGFSISENLTETTIVKVCRPARAGFCDEKHLFVVKSSQVCNLSPLILLYRVKGTDRGVFYG